MLYRRLKISDNSTGWCTVIAGLILLSAGFGYTQYMLAAYSGNRIVMDLRVKLFAHIQRLPVVFFDRKRSGDLTSHLSNDVGMLQSTLTEDIVKLPGNVVVLFGGMGWPSMSTGS